jgi:crotonobetaine/carnitine-CoA ligase
MNTPDSVNTIPALLDDRVARYGNREFLRFEDASFGFEDLRDASRSVAAGLQALGLTKGDKVALLMSNRPEFLFSWFALAMLGAVEVPVNTAHKGSLLRYMLEQADCRFLIVDSALYAQLEQIPGDLELLEQVIVLDDLPQSDCGKPLISFDTLQRADSAALPEINAADPVAIMFTSGTTGPSKGAVVPQQYPLSMGRIVAWSGDYNDEDCLYNALPLFHGNAQFLSTLPALLSGARMVLAKRFSASSFWEDVKRYGCTEFNYIGGILPILMKAEPKPDDADNPLRVMVGAGAPADLSAAFEKRFGLQLVEAYGMSEIGIPMTNTLHKRKLGTCGFQHPDYDVFLQADDGSEAGVDEPGELLIRPKKFNGMMLEYYRMPEKTVEAWSNLWFHTGDYLKRDADGWFYFVDRKKDALRRRGENISSYEVEREINAHPAVLESAAIAVKSELGEDELMVVVCRKPGATLDAEALIAHCQEKMAYFMVPRYLRFVDAMPKTPTERIQKFKLRSEGVTADTFDREAGTQR